MGVVGDFLKTELAAQGFEVSVVGVGECGGQVHAAAAAESNLGVLRNHAFVQRCECDRELDGGAGLRAA
jgi:hypothetical protein